MLKSVVYQGNSVLGEVEIYPQKNQNLKNIKEIRISHFSQPSERCPPLAVLHTIAPSGLCFKLESTMKSSPQSQEDWSLFSLHSSCLRENKTAVMTLGEEELHLVAMPSRRSVEHHPCFWGFTAATGLYNSCLTMLNLRCLGIVFDLDETLIVANTMRSFEDRIDALQRKIHTEGDPQRVSGMLAEIKRYEDDKSILKQYVDGDQVVDNGRVIKSQVEFVPSLSEDHQRVVRPLIRLPEKNIVLTRINPLIRDTSVLVRLRPAWEDLRSYLMARGRKRFEVYVCTMAEKEYAFEMWRLLDPESKLINSKQLLDRIVCVKAGSRKSLLNVFHDGICHPKMALVIDDRLKVWDEKDQPRVHVVPAFAPYYAPQAEANNVIPVLCVARNVACNVRGGFFKEFDDGLLQKISEASYEDDLAIFPSAPDVSNYLISEDDASTSSKNPLGSDGMADIEVERRLKDPVSSSSVISTLDPRQSVSFQPAAVASLLSTILQPTPQPMPIPNNLIQPMPAPNNHVQNNIFPPVVSSVKSLGNIAPVEPNLRGSPAREEGEVQESELDPDMRRRLLIMQHGQDTRDQTSCEPPFPVRPPPQVPIPPVYSRGVWPPMEEKITSRQLNLAIPKLVTKEVPLESDTNHFDKQRNRHPPVFRGLENSFPSDRFQPENQRLPKEANRVDDRLRPTLPITKKRAFPGEEMSLDPALSSNEEHPAGVLQKIARKCRTTVEFKTALISSTELQFSIEVWFAGEKLGEATGRTRKEAQHQAAEQALKNLANQYLSVISPDAVPEQGDPNRLLFGANENGFVGDTKSSNFQAATNEGFMPVQNKPESSRFLDPRLEGPKRLSSSILALKELCTMEGLALLFQDHSVHEGEFHAEVEIGGQVLGKGLGSTWEEAKMRASEQALGILESMAGQGVQNQAESPRSLNIFSAKRQKPEYNEYPRVLQRMPSSLKYSSNTPPVS